MHQAAVRALSFLENSLHPNNLYPVFIASDPAISRPQRRLYDYFSTAVITYLLPHGRLKKRLLDNFFSLTDKHLLFTFSPDMDYPPDTDTNSFIYSLLLSEGYPVTQQAHLVMDEIVRYSRDGVVQVWLDTSRKNHFDPVVAVNAQVLACLLHRQKDLTGNLEFIRNHLISGRFRSGTRYYHDPRTFLFFLARLALIDHNFSQLIISRFQDISSYLQPTSCQPIALAQSVILSKMMNLNFDMLMQKLLSLQREDGSLPSGALFRFGNRAGYFGSEFISTAFFIYALNFKIK